MVRCRVFLSSSKYCFSADGLISNRQLFKRLAFDATIRFLLAASDDLDPLGSGTGATATLGVALILVATVCYAIALNMVTPAAQKYGSLPVMAHVLGSATLLVTPFGIYGLTQSSFTWPAFMATLALGAVGTGIAFYMMGALVGSVGATRSAFLTYLIPVVALTLGVVFRDEVVAPLAIAGVGLVIVGAFLASRRDR